MRAPVCKQPLDTRSCYANSLHTGALEFLPPYFDCRTHVLYIKISVFYVLLFACLRIFHAGSTLIQLTLMMYFHILMCK